jgi:DNA-binding HxlR family transcriptional regulator
LSEFGSTLEPVLDQLCSWGTSFQRREGGRSSCVTDTEALAE